MNPKYKELVIRGLYGLIEGSSAALESSLKSDFNLIFGLKPELEKI